MIQSFYPKSRLNGSHGELVRLHHQSYARLARLKFIYESFENSFLIFILAFVKDFLNSSRKLHRIFLFLSRSIDSILVHLTPNSEPEPTEANIQQESEELGTKGMYCQT